MIRGARLTAALLVLSGCGPLQDTVFSSLSIELEPAPIVTEGAGVVELGLRLSRPAAGRVAAGYRLRGLEAQDDCQDPDFEAAAGRVEWAPGEQLAGVRVWVFDDELAETDERFELVLEPLEGLPESAPMTIEITIADDDRSALIEAAELAADPGAPGDRGPVLQAVLDRAAALGRAVVVVPPGDYTIAGVELPPGTTLSARGARFVRPPAAALDQITVRVTQRGAANSAPTLIEGLSVDGRREEQGPYRDREREHAHLIEIGGDPEQGGRAIVQLERLSLVSGTASGVMIRTDAEVTVCGLAASELWRDALTASGGAAVLRVRDIDASASEGTGLWLGARTPGSSNSYALQVELEDVQIGAGDVEIEATTGSHIALRRLTMLQAPFRLDAPDGVVRISDSVLVTGQSSAEHDYVGRPRDVEVRNTTLVVSESSLEPLSESARTLSAISVAQRSLASGGAPEGPGRLLFDGCRFERAADVEDDDQVYAVQSSSADASVIVRNSTIAPGFSDWFAPDCAACSLEP